MADYSQQTMHNLAQIAEDMHIEVTYEKELGQIETAAKAGAFTMIFPRSEISTELIVWLIEKGYEVYTASNSKDDWERYTYLNMITAKRVKVVW